MGRKKKTNEDFLKEVYELVGEEYTVLTNYIGSTDKITMCHNKCWYTWDITPISFIRGNRCPNCSKLNRTKTHEQYINEMYELVENEYVVLGQYVNSQTKIEIQHTVCENVYHVRPNDFLNGKRCPKCKSVKLSENKKKSHDEFVKEVYDLVNISYLVIGHYEDSRLPLEMKHNECGNIYSVKPNSFLQGNRCPFCFGNIKKTTEIFKSEVMQLVGYEYKVLGDYVNNRTKIKMKHHACGNEYNVLPDNFLRGRRCPNCFGNKKKTTEQFKSEVFKLVGLDYDVLGEYTNIDMKIKMKHNKCEHEYEVVPYDFLKGRRCPKCNSSKGELKVAERLNSMGIKYVCQYKFIDCKFKRLLPFDFAIFDRDNNLIQLIEYDGEGHFEPFRFSKNKEKMLKKLKETQFRDNIKNEYCKKNNILLLRIPYWDFNNIEDILFFQLGYLK